MSDILIAQEVGTVVVIETAPAEIVEVVAVGPQGPVGDVNPQMPVILAATEAARDAALVSKLAAAASQSAAATSAANAATSESNAATSAATATAQATASADSATASAGSAAAAQASATNAANSESNAANSATASANSATSSANSATAAQAAKTATESARDTTLATIGTAALKANNLSDLANAATARSNLGLGNVNNTSDANKPISTATQLALDGKAPSTHVGATGTAHGSATTLVAGFMSSADKTKLDGVATNANNYSHPTGDGNLHVPATGTTNNGKVLKAGATTGALVWGTLAKADVGLGSVDNTSDANKPISTATQTALNDKESTSNKGVANGYAGLDATGKVPVTQLPSYVDDVLEFANLAGFPATGETGKIYVALDTDKTYRWSGSAYIYISSGAVDSVAGKTGVVTLVKGDVGLGNVDNTSDTNKPISTATQTALNAKQNASTAVTKDSASGVANIPAGTSAQRPASPPFGAQRANSTIGAMEWWNGTAWAPMGDAAPPGHVAYFACNYAPPGYLKANGALVSRTTYAALFAAIGTTYGAGDGVTTFKLPDCRGEFLRGLDDGRGVDAGRVIGSEQGGAIQSHNHVVYTAGSGNVYVAGGANNFPSAYNTTGSTGGSETRPRNIAMLACIKF